MPAKPRTIPEPQFVELVAERLAAALDEDRDMRLCDVARWAGYSTIALQQFRGGQYRSFRLALRLVEVMPDLLEDLRHPDCGCLPTITWRRRPVCSW